MQHTAVLHAELRQAVKRLRTEEHLMHQFESIYSLIPIPAQLCQSWRLFQDHGMFLTLLAS